MIPEQFIVSVYESLKIQNYAFENIFEKVMNKECSDYNIKQLIDEKINYSDLKKLIGDSFYYTMNHDDKFFKIQKIIFEHLIKYFTKSNGEMNLPDYFSMLLYLVNNSDQEKSKIFFNIHYKNFKNDSKNFSQIVLNYIQDILFLLSNIIIEDWSVYDNPESLTIHLSSFSVQKVEYFFNKYLHKDITNLQLEKNIKDERIFQILKNISFVFNFNKIREIFIFFFDNDNDKKQNYSSEQIHSQLKNYYQARNNSILFQNNLLLKN